MILKNTWRSAAFLSYISRVIWKVVKLKTKAKNQKTLFIQLIYSCFNVAMFPPLA